MAQPKKTESSKLYSKPWLKEGDGIIIVKKRLDYEKAAEKIVVETAGWK